MNELIKQLAEQSLADSTLIGNDEVYRPVGYQPSVSKVFADRFAELIVRECAVELMKLGNSYSECETDADYMQGMLDSADIIKEHFGVK